jgi:hypothetical protein
VRKTELIMAERDTERKESNAKTCREREKEMGVLPD